MVDFESLDFKTALEGVREKLNPLYVKHEYLYEMLRELYDQKDFGSDTVKYLRKKIEVLDAHMEILRKVRGYLANLVDGVPFQIDREVGRRMARFGLTEEHAELLVNTYKEHRKSMDPEDRQKGKFLLVMAKKAEWNEEENCLHVHFDEDTCFHYFSDGTWY